jgi:ATP-dependent Clp protease ATP-binding subunit ClpC
MALLEPSAELITVRAESQDVAARLGHQLTSAHLLLCLFTIKNQASVFLSSWSITGDRLLEQMASLPLETDNTVERIMRRAHEVASVGKAPTITCLHMLVALCSFVDSAAYQLMVSSGAPIARMRSDALAHMQKFPGNLGVPEQRDDSVGDTAGRTNGPPVVPRRAQPQPQPGPARSVPTTLTTAPTGTGARPARGPRRPDDVPVAGSTAPPAPANADPQDAAQRARTSTSDLAARMVASTPIAASPVDTRARVASWEPPARSPQLAQVRRNDLILRENQFPLLSKLGRNLTLLAFDGQIDRVVGRDAEIDQLVDVLNRRRSNNPVLVGDPGVGKTAVVEGLAHRMIGTDGAPPLAGMENKLLIELEASRMLSNTSLRGSFAERLQALKKEVSRADGRIIVFLDELHHWIGMGAGGDGNTDGAGELKTALARGEFPCVGATTWEEYRKYIESDPAFERRFQVVRVSEPTPEQAIEILRGVVPDYAQHHHVAYDDDTVEAAVRLSHRYLPDRRLPDKALGIMDLAGSRARRTRAAQVDRRLIAEVLAEQAGISADKLLLNDRERFIGLEDRLMSRIIGQRHAVERVAMVLRRNYAGFVSGRPIGSFLFLGSTGVGKTEFARAMANVLFHDDNAMTRIDMSEYLEAHSVARLIGAPPGYIGHDSGGILTEAVRRRPYQLVLLDELEKAHPDVLNLLIQVLEDGRLTDSRGRTVDFSNVVLVMTSNLGADAALRKTQRPAGFGTGQSVAESGTANRDAAMDQARKSIRPELWNRFDETIVFDPLTRDDVGRIARLQLTRSSERLGTERGIRFICGPDVVEWLIDHGGFEPDLGARPMRRAIERHIEARIADAIVHGLVAAPALVELRITDDTVELVLDPTVSATSDSPAVPSEA